MKIVMDRSYCDAALPFCARCSAAYFQKPLGTDRPCIVDIVDDGNEEMLHFTVLTDGRTLEFDLTEEIQEGLAMEGWEFLPFWFIFLTYYLFLCLGQVVVG